MPPPEIGCCKKILHAVNHTSKRPKKPPSYTRSLVAAFVNFPNTSSSCSNIPHCSSRKSRKLNIEATKIRLMWGSLLFRHLIQAVQQMMPTKYRYSAREVQKARTVKSNMAQGINQRSDILSMPNR